MAQLLAGVEALCATPATASTLDCRRILVGLRKAGDDFQRGDVAAGTNALRALLNARGGARGSTVSSPSLNDAIAEVIRLNIGAISPGICESLLAKVRRLSGNFQAKGTPQSKELLKALSREVSALSKGGQILEPAATTLRHEIDALLSPTATVHKSKRRPVVAVPKRAAQN